MTTDQIKKMQERIKAFGFYEGEIDGKFGPKSEAGVKAYLRSLMPVPHPFPKEEDVAKVFGEPGNVPTVEIELPFAIYYEGKAVTKLRPHKLVAASLLRVFKNLATVFPLRADRDAAGITVYDGLYNPRKKRGGSSWSMHAWAIAIDFDAEHNGNTTPWPEKATMPLEVMECFAREGWESAGAFWGRDAMHFQGTQPE